MPLESKRLPQQQQVKVGPVILSLRSQMDQDRVDLGRILFVLGRNINYMILDHEVLDPMVLRQVYEMNLGRLNNGLVSLKTFILLLQQQQRHLNLRTGRKKERGNHDNALKRVKRNGS